MADLWGIDWSSLFGLSVAPQEIILRGTAVYWFLFLIFRFVVRRDVGAVGIADLLLLVIVADASQNAMSGDYETISDGMLLVATLIAWNIVLDRLSYRFPAFRRFAEPKPLCLVSNGHIVWRNMRREYLTEEELLEKLREQGIASLAGVKDVFLESDGQFSVIRNEEANAANRAGQKTVRGR
jgi:uncharacterized membrane protein YcaP (DUF421 family)